jgi:hypothetical protein
VGIAAPAYRPATVGGGFHAQVAAALLDAAQIATEVAVDSAAESAAAAASLAPPLPPAEPTEQIAGDPPLSEDALLALQSPPPACRSVSDCGYGILGHGTVCDRSSQGRTSADDVGVCREACRTPADCRIPAICMPGLDPMDPSWRGCVPKGQ